MEVEGIIVGYARGGGRQYTNRVIIRIVSSDVKRVASIAGGKVYYVDNKGKRYTGRVLKMHGKRNLNVIARFKRNIPGQALGSKVKLVK